MKSKYHDLIGVLRISETFGKYKVVEIVENGSQVKLWLFKIVFEDTKNEYYEKWDKIRKNKVKDLKLIKQQKAEKTRKKIIDRNRLIKKSCHCFNIEGLENSNLMSLDFATRSIGISIFINGKHKGTGGITSCNDDFRKRTVKIVDKILIGIEKYNINAIAIEDIYLSRNSNILSMLAEARGFLMYHIVKKGIRKEIIPATVWQHHFNFPKHREDIKRESLKRYNEKFKTCIKCDDLSDSYWIGKYCVNKSK